jgi:hypothetical protein
MTLNEDLPLAEYQLLLHCARTRMDDERVRKIRSLINEGLDWEHLLKIAEWHGMLPLLYWHLGNKLRPEVPFTFLSRLHNDFLINTHHNLFLLSELLTLLGALYECGIAAVPFKGPVLAVLAYKNIALRQIVDLDIWIREPDFPRAKALLLSRGYNPWMRMTKVEEAIHLRHAHAYTLVRDDGVSVDLHWSVVEKFSPLYVDLSDCWKRLTPMRIEDSTIFSLPVEDLIVVSYLQGSRDCWRQLKLVCDFSELIQAHPEINWEQVLAQAGRLGSKRRLSLGLLLAHELCEAAIPETILLEAQTDSTVRSLSSVVHKALFSEDDKRANRFESILISLKMKDRLRLRDRVRYLTSPYWLMPNIKDKNILPLPHYLAFLYYLLRPLRLVREQGLNVLKQIAKSFGT